MDSCAEYIFSEEYADLIYPFYGDTEYFLKNYQPDCFLDIGGGLAVSFKKGDYGQDAYGYYPVPKCFGLLDTSNIDTIGVNRLRRQPYLGFRGNGVLIGVLDTGIDYTHPAFLNPDGTTRIAAIWDQTVPPSEAGENTEEGQDVFYGREYLREQINEALASEDPYSIVPQRDEDGHGTAMTGIIAGNEIVSEHFSGVAPGAELVIVKLKQAKKNLRDFFRIKEEIPCFQETDLLFGIQYLLKKARKLDMPMVVYFGVGTNQGSHTGNTPLCNYVRFYSNLMGVNFVAAAGNETNRGHHVFAEFEEDDTYQDVQLRVAEGEEGFSMEIWVNSIGFYSVGLLSPAGEFTGKIPQESTGCHISTLVLERVKICTSYHVVEPYSMRRLILVRFFNIVPGNWTIRIYNDNDMPADYHIWLPMHGFLKEDTRFLAPSPDVIICDPGNGEALITVSGYDHRTGGIYLYSSRGYTALDRVKPDLTSPAVNIMAPAAGGGYTTVTGTSVAAAHVAGMSAILWEWGIVEGFSSDIRGGDIRRLLIMGAERIGFFYPNREFGFGIANIYGAFEVMRTPIT